MVALLSCVGSACSRSAAAAEKPAALLRTTATEVFGDVRMPTDRSATPVRRVANASDDAMSVSTCAEVGDSKGPADSVLRFDVPTPSGFTWFTVHKYHGSGRYDFTSGDIGTTLEFSGLQGSDTAVGGDARTFFAPTPTSSISLEVAADGGGHLEVAGLERDGVSAAMSVTWTCIDRTHITEAELTREMNGEW